MAAGGGGAGCGRHIFVSRRFVHFLAGIRVSEVRPVKRNSRVGIDEEFVFFLPGFAFLFDHLDGDGGLMPAWPVVGVPLPFQIL